MPEVLTETDQRDRVDAAAIVSYYPGVKGSEKIALEDDIVEALRSARNEPPERARLEREVIEAAKKWNSTNHRDMLKCEETLTRLGDAVDALEKFESSQLKIKK